MKNSQQIQPARGAGRWFPGSRDSLRNMVEEFIDNAQVPPPAGSVAAAISPHAGFEYSGPVAGYTFRALREAAKAGHTPDIVLVTGFSHRGSFPGIALLPGSAIRTPLGDITLDNRLRQEMLAGSNIIFADQSLHHDEHSAENLLPFLQMALPDTPVTVAIIGDHEPDTIDELMTVLQKSGQSRNILLLASTDLLHDPDYHKVTQTDQETLRMICALDTAALTANWSYTNQLCCGIAPVQCAMRWAAMQGCTQGSVLHYRNSGDDFPESRGEWVVGYGSVIFTKKGSSSIFTGNSSRPPQPRVAGE